MPKVGRFQRLNRGDLATGGQFTRLAKEGNIYMGPPLAPPKKEGTLVEKTTIDLSEHETEVKALNMRIGALRKELQQIKSNPPAPQIKIVEVNNGVEEELRQQIKVLEQERQESGILHEKTVEDLKLQMEEAVQAAAGPKKKGSPSKALLEARARLKEKEEEIEHLKEALTIAEDTQGELAEPVAGMRILEIKEVIAQDGIVRMDCSIKATTGPLGDEVAIILAEKEIEKILDATFEETPDAENK